MKQFLIDMLSKQIKCYHTLDEVQVTLMSKLPNDKTVQEALKRIYEANKIIFDCIKSLDICINKLDSQK